MMKQPIVVLGAGIYQLGLIRKAQSLGYFVHVVSRMGNYPGIPLADEFHPIDTTDKAGVLELCEKVHPMFVVTSGTDVCMPTIGYVNDQLGLPGVRSFAAETMSSKTKFRSFELANGIDCPKFHVCQNVDDAWTWFSSCGADALLKPSMASGSRGIFRAAQGILRDEFSLAFSLASKSSHTGDVCLEMFLPGREIGGNAILKGGKCHFLAISRKHLDGFLVTGHEYPTDLTCSQQKRVREVLERCVSKLGYSDGPLNFDMMVDCDDVRIIEPCARFGGNGLVDLCENAFGVDLEMNMLRSLGGREMQIKSMKNQHCGSYVFGSETSGALRSMASLDEVRIRCPWVKSLTIQRKIGDSVSAMRSNADLIGFAIFDIPLEMSWEQCATALSDSIGVVVE